MDAWQWRLRMLERNIEVRRAAIKRMKVKLESMGKGILRRSSVHGDNNTVTDLRANSRTTLTGMSIGNNKEVVGVFYREEEEVLDMVKAFRVFVD